MKIRVHTRACVCIVGFYTLIFHFPVLTQRRSIKKSQEKKKKRSCHFYFTQKESGSVQNLKREHVLQKLELIITER